MRTPLATSLALCALLFGLDAQAAQERTLWLVQALYPGQEALIARTEAAIAKLMPQEGRALEVIGQKELVAALRSKNGELPCLFGDKPCAEPVNALVSSLGFDRVVLIRGGQDGSGYQFKVASYRPETGEVTPASDTQPHMEKALLGALVKVVPLASTLDVTSAPSNATVYVDDVRVGTTPLSTQVIPGEHLIKLDLKSHQPLEETLVVPARGSVNLHRSLEKVAARITVSASPSGAQIFLDGALAGRDKIDRGIQPGRHTVRLTLEGHKDFEATIDVRPDDSYTLDKSLEPIAVAKEPEVQTVIIREQVVTQQAPPVNPGAQTPPGPIYQPPPPEEPTVAVTPPAPEIPFSQTVYDRRSYLELRYDSLALSGSFLEAQRYGSGFSAKTSSVLSDGRDLPGISIEYGSFGEYFGLAVLGVSYLQSAQPWRFSILDPETVNGETRTEIEANVQLFQIRALQPQLRLVLWRFMFSAQGGLELRTGKIRETGSPFYVEGFEPLDLMVGGRGTVRLFLFEGLYLEAAYGGATNLTGKGSGVRGFHAGAGYAF